MNRIQLIDLDTSSEEEEMGGMMILRKVMRSRLGWLSTAVEPHMKQEAETTEMVKDVVEVHEEEQIQATRKNQPSHALRSTNTLEITEAVKDEKEKINKEQKDMIGKPNELEITEAVKDEKEETSKEQKDMIKKPNGCEVKEAVKDEKEQTSEEQKDVIGKPA